MPRHPIHRWLFLYCILIFVLKDCQSLFLRHNQTGKCIAASEELVYNTPDYALPYFVKMTDNCLEKKAQFRYLDSQSLHNIEKEGTLMSSKNTEYMSRWAVYKGVAQGGRNHQRSADHRLKQTAAGSLFFYNAKELSDRVCAEPAVSSNYVLRKTSCGTTKQEFTFGAVTAFNAKMENVHCSPIQRMMVKSSDYGEFDNNGAFNKNAAIDTQCSKLTNCQVKSLCGGNRSCELTMDNSLLPSQYCSNTSKQIYTKYICADEYKSNSITEFNVRLSQSPNKGFIEIKNGSTWKKVKEHTWDKHRQKMLCQHLRFNETDENNIDTRIIGSGNGIASGDLICYKTQPNKISCCTHLESSTTTADTTVPYVTCGKICDKPLLQDLTNSAFSGSGGSRDYEQGKFSNDGWCANGSDYLLIDLQNEYHITRVITMGDKSQTNWSDAFTLTYNHNESLAGRNNVQITGNQNGYQASFTTVDIYNVRHVKIESATNNFCLRIELCGEVQSPAPVQKTNAKPSNFSVHLSWTIPEAKMSTYITHFIIYLNGTRSDGTRIVKISRMKYGNEFVLSGLTPDTEYTVGIQAQDGSSKNARIVHQRFKTKEAVPSGPPMDVTVNSRGKDSLGISWKAPDKNLRNGKLTGYQICYNSAVINENQNCSHIEQSPLSYNIPKLQPSTKYFVTVAAGTKIGYGNKSLAISKITNGEPITPVSTSYSSLNLTLVKQATYIKEVIVVVQISSKNPTPVEDIQTKDLKPYQDNTHEDPYITAYFKTDVLPSTFVIGDGKEYTFENRKYCNHPLKQNSSYIVFVRFFETKDSYYSTEWSRIVKTMMKPPAPEVNIVSTGLKNYTITWSSSPPNNQTVLKYYITYKLPNRHIIQFNVSNKNTSYNITTEFNKKYTFEVQVETNAGKSEITSKSWYSHSESLETPEETDEGYKVILKKPKAVQKIKTVDLIVLLQQSDSGKPPSPEQLDVQNTPPDKQANNFFAFVAETFPIQDFKNGNLEVFLRGNDMQRTRRDTRVVTTQLIQNAKYRIIQRNKDENNNSHWSYWSDFFVYTPIGVVTSPTTGSSVSTNLEPSSGILITSDPGSSTSGKGNVGAVVGATIAVVAIVTVLVLAVIFLKRRGILQRYLGKESVDDLDEMEGIENGGNDGLNGNKTEGPLANDDIYSNETGFVHEAEHPAVPVAAFAHYVNEMKAKENYAFQSEYDNLPANRNTSWEVAKRSFNKQKNRYGNIVTYDHCRVLLSGDENEDYINASYIDGIKTNSYIASQGPTKLTVNDMWRMVWEQNTYSIVMVTSLVELGKPKCEKYWPDSESKMYGDIEVTLMKTEEFADHVTHTLELKKDGEEREVRHYYFQSWPDHGVPRHPTQLLAFRRQFRTHHLEQSGPIIVHCSAGVGRTGVFLAIDTILDKLEKGVINSIDVFGQVCAMRERRMNMVQTLEQYIFIHEAILETILCGMNEVDSSRIQIEVTNLAQVQANGMTGFQEKFERLCEVSPKLSNEECIAGLLEENYNKNRNKNVYPAECSRVALQYINGEENSDYINAVFVDGFLGRNYFVATQSPLPNTITDFWRLVHSQKSSTIVLLNNVKDGTSFPRFWPTRRGEPTHYGSMTVQLDSEGESSGIWTRKFIISPYPDLSDGHVVSMFHYTKWPDHRVPANGSGVITLTSMVEKTRQSHGEGPVIVACSDGAGRTGTYIAISNLLERMKIEQTMDVFQSIKIIRGTRPQFVENVEQYQFCYTAIMAYLDAFSEYANFE